MPHDSIQTMQVLLHSTPIGTLTRFPSERIVFEFDPAYIENKQRDTLSLSLKDQTGAMISTMKSTRFKLPPFFSNLLPEGTLHQFLANQFQLDIRREFDLLALLGLDLPGAITVKAIEPNQWGKAYDPSIQDGVDSQKTLRFSLAGVQLKLSAVLEKQGRLTIPAHGVGGNWIVKLPSAQFDALPENEYAMMTLARQIGIDIPDVALKPVKDIVGLPDHIPLSDAHALMIKRFDRGSDGQRVHIEDFAQVFNAYPKDKYTRASYRNIAHVLSRETALNDMAEFIRRLVFNTLIGNADMHLKNWSLIYPDGKTPQLAPGYDFVSTIAYLPDNKMALNYVREKNMFDLSLDLLSHFASKAGLPETLVMNTAKETVRSFQTHWKAEKTHLPLSTWVINNIEQHMRQIPLVREV